MKYYFAIRHYLTIVILVMLILLAGCSKESGTNPTSPTLSPKSISLLVYGTIQKSAIVPTRATDKAWEANDAIGIYQVNTVQNEQVVSSLMNNRKYVIGSNTTEGKFEPATDEQAITLTETSTLHAYYPYKESLADNTYNINLTDQTNIEKIDLMIAKGIATVAAEAQTTAVYFNFKHRFCKIEATIINEIKLENFTKDHLKASISHQHAQGSYNLANDTIITTGDADATITMKILDDNNTDDNKIKVEAVLLPNNPADEIGQRTMTFNVGGKTYEYTIPANHVYKANTKVTYEIKITPKELVVNATITDWENDTIINYNGESTEGEAYEAEN